jgi:ribosomal protein S18 acetylase RimI-like enzyme
MAIVTYRDDFLARMAEDFKIGRHRFRAYARFLPEGFFCAVEDGEVVGFLVVGFEHPGFLMPLAGLLPLRFPASLVMVLHRLGVLRRPSIYHVIVRRDFRGRGVGGRLLERGEGYVRDRLRSPDVHLMVRKDNARALGVYTGRGYEIVDEDRSRRKFILRKSL